MCSAFSLLAYSLVNLRVDRCSPLGVTKIPSTVFSGSFHHIYIHCFGDRENLFFCMSVSVSVSVKLTRKEEKRAVR